MAEDLDEIPIGGSAEDYEEPLTSYEQGRLEGMIDEGLAWGDEDGGDGSVPIQDGVDDSWPDEGVEMGGQDWTGRGWSGEGEVRVLETEVTGVAAGIELDGHEERLRNDPEATTERLSDPLVGFPGEGQPSVPASTHNFPSHFDAAWGNGFPPEDWGTNMRSPSPSAPPPLRPLKNPFSPRDPPPQPNGSWGLGRSWFDSEPTDQSQALKNAQSHWFSPIVSGQLLDVWDPDDMDIDTSSAKNKGKATAPDPATKATSSAQVPRSAKERSANSIFAPLEAPLPDSLSRVHHSTSPTREARRGRKRAPCTCERCIQDTSSSAIVDEDGTEMLFVRIPWPGEEREERDEVLERRAQREVVEVRVEEWETLDSILGEMCLREEREKRGKEGIIC